MREFVMSPTVAQLFCVRLMRVFVFVGIAISLLANTGFAAGFDLASASRVQAYRLAPVWDKHYVRSKRFLDAKLVSGPKLLSPSDATIATRELERIYPIDWPDYYCAFSPR